MQESNKMLLGKILSTIGAISEQDVHRMLRLKAEESIYDVFSWSRGGVPVPRPAAPERPTWCRSPSTSPRSCSKGMQRFDEWKRIREVDSLLRTACRWRCGAFDEKLMTEGAPQILALIDDDRTIARDLQAHPLERVSRLSHPLPAGAAPGA